MTRLYLSPPHLGGEELRYIEEAVSSNWIAPLGPMVDAFEQEFAQVVGIPHAVALASGTAALHLALRSIGLKADDVVVAATLTFVASVSPAVHLGAKPVFVDVSEETWTADPSLIEEVLDRLRRKGQRVGAIIPTDLYGQSCDLDAICEVGLRYDVPVVADSAESLGALYKGRSVGDGATATAFSFNGNKIITTSCGGMLVSHDRRIVEYARFLSQQARDPAPYYQHSTLGYNYRMSNILAGLGRAQLKLLANRVAKRRSISNKYAELLAGINGITMMPEASYGTASRWLTVIIIDPQQFGVDRDAVMHYLDEQGIESRPVWKPMHLQPVFSDAEYRGRGVSDLLFRTGLCLPSGSQMTDDHINRVVEGITAARDKAYPHS